MPNTNLTIDMVTGKSLEVLHQEANFLKNINTDYDDSFAQKGAKIGDTLRVRLPNEYTIRRGAVMSVQDKVSTSVNVQVSTILGVDLDFTDVELALDIDRFTELIIRPAVKVLVANVESEVYTGVMKEVYNVVDSDGNSIDMLDALDANKVLTDNLAEKGDRRCFFGSTAHMRDLVNSNKGLFQSSSEIAKQYEEGMMGRHAGFKWYENTHVGDHTTGTAAKVTGYQVDGTAESGGTITVDTGSNTFLKGDVITIVGVNRVHPETKVNTGILQQFVITADSGASATSLSISPSLTVTGGKQNVTGVPADNALIVKVAAGASELMNSSMAFHKNAFTFATADLRLPRGAQRASRVSADGISLRLWEGDNIQNNTFPTRLDILFGFRATRPQLAVRVHADG